MIFGHQITVHHKTTFIIYFLIYYRSILSSTASHLCTFPIILITMSRPEPYPTAYVLEGMFHEVVRGNMDKFLQYCTPECKYEVAGSEHSFKGMFSSAAEVKAHQGQMADMLDESTIKREVVRVIGGGVQPWAAVEFRVTATSKSGTLFVAAFLPCLRTLLGVNRW